MSHDIDGHDVRLVRDRVRVGVIGAVWEANLTPLLNIYKVSQIGSTTMVRLATDALVV